MGGEDLPGLDLPTLWRAWFSGSALSPGVRRPGRRLFLRCRAVRGDGAGELRRVGGGGGPPGAPGRAAARFGSEPRPEGGNGGVRGPRPAPNARRGDTSTTP